MFPRWSVYFFNFFFVKVAENLQALPWVYLTLDSLRACILNHVTFFLCANNILKLFYFRGVHKYLIKVPIKSFWERDNTLFSCLILYLWLKNSEHELKFWTWTICFEFWTWTICFEFWTWTICFELSLSRMRSKHSPFDCRQQEQQQKPSLQKMIMKNSLSISKYSL